MGREKAEDLILEIETILTEARKAIEAATDQEALEEVRVAYLGRRGKLSGLLRELKNIPQEIRPRVGEAANRAKRALEDALAEKKEKAKKPLSRHEDWTFPGRRIPTGYRHPLTQVTEEIEAIFLRMGFDVEGGPEIETEHYNFDGLNIPTWHPSRDEWDSFYLEDGRLLRTHTSPVQLRVMEKRKPPLRVVAHGRCFRRDAVDRTHSHTFHQLEGFMVDEGVSFAHLKGVIEVFAKALFGEDVNLRFRPDFFPFTEPSADGAVSCFRCAGKGCPVCSHTGWLEIFGCGMIHPKVLERCGIDPQRYAGFAFGMGIERIAMIKYGIDDIRLFLENDLRFLRQFPG